MNTPYEIYGDSISGNCLKVKWSCELLGIPYKWHEISVLKKETQTDDFLTLNPAGQVPIIRLPSGEILSQSNAIILHLFHAHENDFLPAAPIEYARVLEWMFWEQYTHEPAIAVRRFHKHYLGKTDEQIDATLLDKGYAALTLMDTHLAKSDYFVGAHLTPADIALVAYTRLAHEGGFSLVNFEHVRRWISHLEQALTLESVQEII